METKKFFIWVLGISTFARLLMAKIVPISGDEAYFIIWAKHLNYGYYEHPPMIGWIMWLFSFAGNDIFIYRMFPVISVVIMSVFMVGVLKEIDENKAYLCASIFLLSPVSILNILSVNDVPLIFFTFLAGVFFYRAFKQNRLPYAALSGFFWGCAFLSKYFSVLFGFSVLFICFIYREKPLWKITAISLLSALPLIFINLLWNYDNCWLNIMFNLFFRNKNLSFNFLSFIVYAIEQIVLMTPFLAIIFIKNGFLWNRIRRDSLNLKFFWYFFIIPQVFFSVLSFIKSIGLHWTASFLPFFFMFAISMRQDILDRAARHAFYLSIAIVMVVLVLVSIPTDVFKSWEKYPQIVMFKEPVELCEAINRESKRRILASTGYTETSVLSYYCKKEFVLFGSMSRSGRYYDYINDFKKFDGRDFFIVSLNKRDAEKFLNYFKTVNIDHIDIRGAKFYFIYGDGFIFNTYRQLYLAKILQMYYNPPDFLPSGTNFFREKYF
ncbi:MAG: glycosyltransferase family 39 protein [Candidatus Omnitrophica bacterium]|nr:glycosyltransferase family 39 protein [Candidatus Omnitrophota bacterium]